MAELLRVETLSAGYGEARVISDLDLSLEDGKSLALLGRNGVGKTTLINSLIGVTTWQGGRIFLGDVDFTPLPPHLRAIRGIGWTPQERNIFRSLTVEENLSSIATPGPISSSGSPARTCPARPGSSSRPSSHDHLQLRSSACIRCGPLCPALSARSQQFARTSRPSART